MRCKYNSSTPNGRDGSLRPRCPVPTVKSISCSSVLDHCSDHPLSDAGGTPDEILFPFPPGGYVSTMLDSTLVRLPAGGPTTVVGAVDPAASSGDIVVVRWCGLKPHNAVARFSSMAKATEVVRHLWEIGVTHDSLSTAAILPHDGAIEALIGVHSGDERLVCQASEMMHVLGGSPCCFDAGDAAGLLAY